MYCKNCGCEVNGAIKFCPQCGQALIANAEDDGEKWYYVSSSNNKLGPFSKDDMMGFVQAERISRETLVWKQGMLEWIPAIQTDLLQTIKDVAPPLPISDKYVWSLATVPILVSWFIEALGLPSVAVTSVVIALNITFMILDSSKLSKSGINTSSWMWTGIVMVPVYLFLRASKTNKKYGYAIAWCLVFLLDLII